MRDKTCSFTGHRPAKLPWGGNESDERCIALKKELYCRLEGVYQAGYTHFICGMAIGCDMFFAEAVLKLQEEHPEITLEAAVPCGSQPDRWPRPLRERYNAILDKCSVVKVLQIEYTPDCMQKRNQYMIDRSSLLLSCFDGRPGGTMSTILYAQRQGLKTIIIDV